MWLQKQHRRYSLHLLDNCTLPRLPSTWNRENEERKRKNFIYALTRVQNTTTILPQLTAFALEQPNKTKWNSSSIKAEVINTLLYHKDLCPLAKCNTFKGLHDGKCKHNGHIKVQSLNITPNTFVRFSKLFLLVVLKLFVQSLKVKDTCLYTVPSS